MKMRLSLASENESQRDLSSILAFILSGFFCWWKGQQKNLRTIVYIWEMPRLSELQGTFENLKGKAGRCWGSSPMA